MGSFDDTLGGINTQQQAATTAGAETAEQSVAGSGSFWKHKHQFSSFDLQISGVSIETPVLFLVTFFLYGRPT